MTPQPVQIKLSVEEALEYQKFDAELRGYQAGVQNTLEFLRRQRLQQILDARKPRQTSDSAPKSVLELGHDTNPEPMAATE